MAEVKKNPCWITTEEAADILGVTRQTVNKMLKKDKFEHATFVKGAAKKILYLLYKAEVEQMAAERQGKAAPEPVAPITF